MSKKISKKEKRELRIKKSIMRAAKQLFSVKGYKNTTIDEITDRALIAKATLYQYFKSKENLFFETIKDSERNLLTLLELKVNRNKDLTRLQKFKALFFYLLAYFEKDYYIIHLFFYREFQFNDQIVDFIQGFIQSLSDKMGEMLVDFRFQGENEKKNLIISVIGACYLQLITWYTNGKKESLKELSKNLFKQFAPFLMSHASSAGVEAEAKSRSKENKSKEV